MAILLGEWGFLDNLDDTSGNNHTASFYNDVTPGTPTFADGPHPGSRALHFTGASQQVQYGRTGLEPAASDGGVISMCWVRSTSASGHRGLLDKFRDPGQSSHRAGFYLFDGKFRPLARWRDDLHFDDNGPLINDGNWHHLAVLDAEDRWAWYIDGVQISGAARSSVQPVVWEAHPWYSGYHPNTPFETPMQSHNNLEIADARIFSGTMTNTEIVQWMNTPILPHYVRDGGGNSVFARMYRKDASGDAIRVAPYTQP